MYSELRIDGGTKACVWFRSGQDGSICVDMNFEGVTEAEAVFEAFKWLLEYL